MISQLTYFNCTLFVRFAECWLLLIVEGFCLLFKCYNTLLKVNDILIYQFCWMLKWFANCFVFVNIDEKLSHFVKLQLRKGVLLKSLFYMYSNYCEQSVPALVELAVLQHAPSFSFSLLYSRGRTITLHSYQMYFLQFISILVPQKLSIFQCSKRNQIQLTLYDFITNCSQIM